MAAPSHGYKESNNYDSSNSEVKSSNKNRICICLLCGLPGSGKTRLLRSLIFSEDKSLSAIPQLETLSVVVVGIEYDSIIPDPMHSSIIQKHSQTQEINGKWKSDRTQIVSATEAIIQHISCNSEARLLPELKPQDVQIEVWQKFSHIIDLLKAERQNKTTFLLVVDDNMYFRSMRYEYYKLAKRYQTGYCQIQVKCSIEKAMERNKGRENIHQVPEEIILKMLDKFEPPDPEKYHWEANSIIVSSEEDVNIDQVHAIIQKAIMNPVQSLEETDDEERLKSRVECSASILHQADLILRKCVATKMTELKSQEKPEILKEMSKHVFQVKEKILHDLKDGHIPLILSKEFNVTNSAQNPNSEFFRYIQNLFMMEISRS